VTVLKHVKMVFDGKAYWLLWNWQVHISRPRTFPNGYNYVSGAFENTEQARGAVTEGWTLIAGFDFRLH